MENLSKTPKYLKALFGLGKIARGTSSWGNSLYVLSEAKRDESPKKASSLVHLGTFRLLCSIPQYWTCPSGCSPVSGVKVKVKSLSPIPLFVSPWTVAYQAPRSMGFSRQEYWSGLPFPSPGDLPNPGIEPGSPALQTDTLPSEPLGKPLLGLWLHNYLWLKL